MSFYGFVQCTQDLLLGGTKDHRSSRFERHEDAQRWVEVTLEANREAGRHPETWGVVPSEVPAEITAEDMRGSVYEG